MTVVNLARRRILSMFAAAPALAARAITENTIKDIGFYAASGGMGPPAYPGVDRPIWDVVGLPKLIWKSLAKQREQRQLNMTRGAIYRQGALDPDIACLNSLSMGFKLNMQRQRDEATWKALEDANMRLWPDQD